MKTRLLKISQSPLQSKGLYRTYIGGNPHIESATIMLVSLEVEAIQPGGSIVAEAQHVLPDLVKQAQEPPEGSHSSSAHIASSP
jgi:hypothetical protein